MVDDDELRRRLELLREQMEAGKVGIANHLATDFQASFAAVRYGPDGQIDLSTVDGRVRSMAMMAAMMRQREDLKDVASLHEIQLTYFSRVEAVFGDLHKEMTERATHPQALSLAMSRDEATVKRVYRIIPEFVAELTEFWQSTAEVARYHLQDLQVLKGVYGGDLFPSYTKNIASTSGLYLDTIVLTDPFMNCRHLFGMWAPQEAVRMFIKHGLNVLQYKMLATSDLSPPIVCVLPFDSSHDEKAAEFLISKSTPADVTS